MNTHNNRQNLKPFSRIGLGFLCGLLIITLLDKKGFAENTALTINPESITIQADNLALKHIISEFETQHSLKFTGFSDFLDNKITLSYQGSKIDGIKTLLKLLEIQNYAFTFNKDQLIQVTTLPSSTSPPLFKKEMEPVIETTKKPDTDKLNSSIVLIKKILPGSQGERIQLEDNDYIIAYNGHRIPSAGRLIEYVNQYKLAETVSIGIVRDEQVLEFTLEGGFIGVQIVTVPVEFEIIENYYRNLGI